MKKVFGVATCDLTGVSGTRPYSVWRNILKRCYTHYKCHQSSYEGCSIVPEWLLYSTFKKWFDANYISGYQLDKDLLVKGNKVYSPETCCFVPQEINKLLTNRKRHRGDFYVGVSRYQQKEWVRFVAHISKGGTLVSLGYFLTPEEAFQAYKSAKEIYVKELATKYFQEGKITQKVYQALMEYQVEITD